MNIIKHIVLIVFILIAFACKKNEEEPYYECDENSTRISHLENKKDYYLPFGLCNDLNENDINHILLNGEDLGLEHGQSKSIDKSGFYELEIVYKDEERSSENILFTTITDEREEAEWGIEAWIPKMFETLPLGSEEVEVIYPRRFVDNIGIPFIFYVKNGGARQPVYTEATFLGTNESFNIKRGVGSICIPANDLGTKPEFNIGGRMTELNITADNDVDLVLRGEISEDVIVEENTVVHITEDLYIASTASLTVNAGAIILIDEAINITNDGPVTFIGEANNPIFVTCSDREKYWGGFISDGRGTQIEAAYTIFSRSGYHDSEEYVWGHARRQALFYSNNTSLNVSYCYMLDHIGQIFYPMNATLNIDNILVQRVKTSGQLNYTTASIQNSVFTDFPDDSQIYRDEDNDALYIHASDVTIDNCVFMFAKDDGLDSGGKKGGVVTVTNSHFEACFHEGAALSSSEDVEKLHTFNNCVFTNCGQGLELGFSSINHVVIADECLFTNNYVGIRFGDNYPYSQIEGKMFIRNSQSLYNAKDIWNMVRLDWSPKLENMEFENTQVSTFTDQYPDLEVISE